MAIFYDNLYLPAISLIYPNSYDIIPIYPKGYKEDWSHDHNAGGILHCRRAGKTAQSLKRNNCQLAQEGCYRLVQGRAAVARESHRFRAVHEESAQNIASQEAQNVRSLQSESFADRSESRPRNNAATYCSRLYPFVCIVATSSALCQVIHIVGGKCVAL